MAIQKSKTLVNGAVGKYWRIREIRLDYDLKRTVVVIALYKDTAKAKSNPEAPLHVDVLTLNQIIESRSSIYTLMRTLIDKPSWFQGTIVTD